jgi:hypothetical protein
MLILPDRNIPRSKVLMPVQSGEWRTPSQAQPKNSLGHENQTRFCVTARIDDGHIVWRGWFDDRDDFDQFLWTMVSGNLPQDHVTQRLPAPRWNPDLQEFPVKYEYHIYQFLTTAFPTTAGWTVPSDCAGVSGQSGEFIDAIGAGGKGGVATSSITGGSGGAWARITSLALTPSGSVFTSIGVRAADTWLNKTTNAAPSATTDGVMAKGGADGSTAGAAIAGGLASASVGASKNNGGGSGSSNLSSTGGGGAASPTGVGGTSASTSFSSPGSTGGSSPGGGAGSVGVSNPNTSAAGGDGTQYDSTHGTGGGSGGGAGGGTTSGRAGQYGAGSGGADVATGTAGPGLLVIAYVPAGGPFGQFETESRTSFLGWRTPKSDQFARNPDLFSQPFAQLDWSKPFPVPDFPAPRTPLPNNINLFTNPVPFSAQWVPTRGVVSSPPQAHPYNTNIFTNPIPLTRFDTSITFRVSDFPTPIQPYNPSLYAVVSVPFSKMDWSTSKMVPDLPPPAQPYNQLIFSEVPFAKSDWSMTRNAPDFLPPVHFYNINIFSAVPFSKADWSYARGMPDYPEARQQALNMALLNLNPIPFAQFDWLKNQRVTSSPSQREPYNSLIFSEVPFSKSDWSTSRSTPDFLTFVQPYNINVYAAVVASPFSNPDWSTVKRVSNLSPQLQPYNPLIFSEQPFAKLDWSSSSRVPDFLSPVQAYNTALLTGTVQNPFNQTMWTPATFPRVRASELSQRNSSLFPNPIPFNNSDWTTPKSVRRITQDGGYNLNLYAATVPAPFVPIDWSKPFYPKAARVAPATSLNLNLYKNPIPFLVYDYAQPSRMYVRPGYFPPVVNHSLTYQFPFSQTSWPVAAQRRPTMPPLHTNNLGLLSSGLLPFAQLDWRTPTRRPTNYPPLPANFILDNILPPANIKVRVYGRADDRSLSGTNDVIYISGRSSGVSIDGYPEPDARS